MPPKVSLFISVEVEACEFVICIDFPKGCSFDAAYAFLPIKKRP